MDKNKKVISIKNLKQNHLVNKLIKLDKILKIGEFLTEQKLKMSADDNIRFSVTVYPTLKTSGPQSLIEFGQLINLLLGGDISF